jgi:hypothetical protein
MSHSKAYAVAFPSHREEYRGIYRKALLHEAVALLDIKGETKYKKEILAKMVKIPFKNVPEKEQILLLETQVRLAKIVRDLDEMMRSSKKMLTYKKLDLKKSHFAYNNLIWASKVTLSFSQAYLYKKRQLNRSKRNKTEIAQLALLAELAGKNSHAHYEEYLKRSHGVLEGNRIRAKIVQSSHIPWGEIKDRIHRMKRSPLLLSELTLETYARFKNTKAAEMVLSHANVAAKPAGKILRRHLEIPKFKRVKNRLVGHKMATRGDAAVQRAIAKRVELLAEMEAIANAAIDRKDFPLQVASLTVLAKEKNRLAKELKSTPSPRGLNGDQLKQYQNILKQKIDAMTAEAIEIARTVDQSWKNEKYVEEKMSSRQQTPLVMQELYAKEAKMLLPFAPNSKKKALIKLSQVSNEAIKGLGQARRQVRQNPFSEEAVVKLRELEFMNNNQSHVAFLDQRLSELNEKVVP